MKRINPAICNDDTLRRKALRQSNLTGLDYLEVDEQDRHKLKVFFIARLSQSLADSLTEANFLLRGGRRTRNLKVVHLEVCAPSDPELDDCVTLTVDRIGDFSTYTLCVVEAVNGRPTGRPHPDFDPRYDCMDFTFTAGCPSDVDCLVPQVCPPEVHPKPEINYLAKDYASFSQLMLDRLAVLIPGWTERHVPDLMLTLVELLAYEGDRLSYLQDAVATEAYLNTARQRVSIRRHARLVDYFLHEGCNARAWMFVETAQDTDPFDLGDFYFTTSVAGLAEGRALSAQDFSGIADDAYEVFEPMAEPPSGQFNRRSLLDPGELGRRLLTSKDPVAKFLRDRLHPAVLEELRSWAGEGQPSQQLVDDLLAELNRLVGEQTLYDEKAFAGQRLKGKTRKLLQKSSLGRMLELNRSVLDSAFQNELVPAGKVRFLTAHNCIQLYTWGEIECCLPKGATSASLLDECPKETQPSVQTKSPGQTTPSDSGPAQKAGGPALPNRYPDNRSSDRCLDLHPGDYLLFEEVLGPHTGLPQDADPTHRHVVRLTKVEPVQDPVLDHTVLEVEWAAADALPFPICISAIGPAPDCEQIQDISVARANILLVDHGRRVKDELPPVEVSEIQQPCLDGCRPELQLIPVRYAPVLSRRDLTYAVPLTPGGPASARLDQDPHQALPSVQLVQVALAPPDILSPDPLARYRAPLLPTAFDPPDLLSPSPLAIRLKADGKNIDPLAAYIKATLDEETVNELKEWDTNEPVPDPLTDHLRLALNALLDDANLYDPGRFSIDELDEPTRALLDARPLPDDLERLFNRWLLEQAFPDVLTPSLRFVENWTARFDLLEADGNQRSFVVEMSNDRRAELRFGDGDLGRIPEPVSRFRAFYRVGSGTQGNVGAETIRHFVLRSGTDPGLMLRPRNPIPARGGTEPEAIDVARLRAPFAIRRDLQRAVTADDYASLTARDFAAELQGAAAELVWTGSWYAARVSPDPIGRQKSSPGLLDLIEEDLEKYRRIGHDLEVVQAEYVPLTILIHVCVKPGYQTAHVLAALREAFSNRRLPSGGLGFFHPDNLRFGQGVAVSRLTATAQALAGVQWARVEKLERMGEGDQGELEAGYLPVHSTEIARVDNDPGFPENGTIEFVMEGGR